MLLLGPPASRRRTRLLGSSESRLATTQHQEHRPARRHQDDEDEAAQSVREIRFDLAVPVEPAPGARGEIANRPEHRQRDLGHAIGQQSPPADRGVARHFGEIQRVDNRVRRDVRRLGPIPDHAVRHPFAHPEREPHAQDAEPRRPAHRRHPRQPKCEEC